MNYNFGDQASSRYYHHYHFSFSFLLLNHITIYLLTISLATYIYYLPKYSYHDSVEIASMSEYTTALNKFYKSRSINACKNFVVSLISTFSLRKVSLSL